MTAEFIAALRAAGVRPTALDVAEALWLAQVVDTAAQAVTGLADAGEGAGAPPVEAPDGPAETAVAVSATGPAPGASLHPRTTADGRSGGHPDAYALRGPGVPALPHALQLGRALRPLRRRVPSRHHRDINEAATAERIAQERLWVPVLDPRPEPEADLAVIADTGASMAIWHRTVHEFLLLMQRIGAFRAIHSYAVDSDADGVPGLRALGGHGAPTVPADSIVDPTGRRLILVVTDGVGAAWHDGRMDRHLQRWARANRLHVLSVLPRRMWRATGLRTSTTPTPPPHRRGERVAVPVLELSVAAIQRRAGAFGDSRGAAVLLPPDSTAPSDPPARDPAEAVWRFLALASPTAQRLAGYLAAAPLTLPTMRLVQHVMLPDSAPTHLAEVYLGGLLSRRSPGAADVDVDIDAVRFEFLPGVRELLLDMTDRADAVDVLTTLSEFVSDRFGQALDFAALLRDPAAAEIPPLNAGTLPIAHVATTVLRGLGPRFAALAARLESAGVHAATPAVAAVAAAAVVMPVVTSAAVGTPAVRAAVAPAPKAQSGQASRLLPVRDGSTAILIGTARYRDHSLPDLPSVSANLEDLRAALTDPRRGAFAVDRVHVILDPVRESLQALRDLMAGTPDTLLVYFAGHGRVQDGELHLGMSDSDDSWSWLPFATLRRLLQLSPARRRVVILDCCYAGRATVAEDAGSDVGMPGTDLRMPGTYVLAATAPARAALAPAGERHTAFTAALLQVLREGVHPAAEVIGIDELYADASRHLRAEGHPSPWRRTADYVPELALGRNPRWQPPAPSPRTDTGVLARAAPGADARTAGSRHRDATPAATGDRLLTPGEVAALFRIDPRTVTRWAAAGRIRSLRTPGGHRRFRESDVRAILENEPLLDELRHDNPAQRPGGEAT